MCTGNHIRFDIKMQNPPLQYTRTTRIPQEGVTIYDQLFLAMGSTSVYNVHTCNTDVTLLRP